MNQGNFNKRNKKKKRNTSYPGVWNIVKLEDSIRAYHCRIYLLYPPPCSSWRCKSYFRGVSRTEYKEKVHQHEQVRRRNGWLCLLRTEILNEAEQQYTFFCWSNRSKTTICKYQQTHIEATLKSRLKQHPSMHQKKTYV